MAVIRQVEPGAQRPAMGLLLRGALVPIGVVGALATVFCAIRSPADVSGALVGTALAALAFSVGPMIMRLAQDWSPPAVMAAATTGYLILIGALAVIYLALLQWDRVSLPAVGWTLLVCAAASIAGLIRAASRVRVLAFGSPVGPGGIAGARAEAPGQPGNHPAPHTRGD